MTRPSRRSVYAGLGRREGACVDRVRVVVLYAVGDEALAFILIHWLRREPRVDPYWAGVDDLSAVLGALSDPAGPADWLMLVWGGGVDAAGFDDAAGVLLRVVATKARRVAVVGAGAATSPRAVLHVAEVASSDAPIRFELVEDAVAAVTGVDRRRSAGHLGPAETLDVGRDVLVERVGGATVNRDTLRKPKPGLMARAYWRRLAHTGLGATGDPAPAPAARPPPDPAGDVVANDVGSQPPSDHRGSEPLPAHLSCLHRAACALKERLSVRVHLHTATFDLGAVPRGAGEGWSRGGVMSVREGTVLRVRALDPETWEQLAAEERLVWTAPVASTELLLTPAPTAGTRRVKVVVLPDGLEVPLAVVHLAIEVGDGAVGTSVRGARAALLRTAFASYAHEDAVEVFERVGALQAWGVDVWTDRLELKGGDAWDAHIHDAIERAERLVLFWSRNAAASPWVEKEWRFALALRGVDGICPTPLEGPDVAPPPPELAERQFGSPADWLRWGIGPR